MTLARLLTLWISLPAVGSCFVSTFVADVAVKAEVVLPADVVGLARVVVGPALRSSDDRLPRGAYSSSAESSHHTGVTDDLRSTETSRKSYTLPPHQTFFLISRLVGSSYGRSILSHWSYSALSYPQLRSFRLTRCNRRSSQ